MKGLISGYRSRTDSGCFQFMVYPIFDLRLHLGETSSSRSKEEYIQPRSYLTKNKLHHSPPFVFEATSIRNIDLGFRWPIVVCVELLFVWIDGEVQIGGLCLRTF